jgi:DNA-binding response OmpR family regulator
MDAHQPRTGRILIVDDDLAILEAVGFALEDAGHEIKLISKSLDGIVAQVELAAPDVIILDMLLSGTDGRNICRLLKSNPSTAPIPVIMMSAHPTAAQSAAEAGADDFLPKPFDIDELLTKVESHLPR